MTRQTKPDLLLVMDNYEHTHQMRYGAAAKYIDALFMNLRWDMVVQRLAAVPRLA